MTEPIALARPDDEMTGTSVRLASCAEEITSAQRLRYQVFYQEYGAVPSPQMLAEGRDFDIFDNIADHLIVVTHDQDDKEHIVGTYRLLRQDVVGKSGNFYSSEEYDLSPLLKSDLSLLELGRSCVLAEYRTKPILNLLWQGIADYITEHNIDLLFGCASFQGTDISVLAEQLSYLHHFHSTPEDLRPRALADRFVNMNLIAKDRINERRVFNSLPPLIKGYLRVGATIGEGAVVDPQFNTTDVCIVVQTSALTQRYRKHYERKIQKTLPGQQAQKDS